MGATTHLNQLAVTVVVQTYFFDILWNWNTHCHSENERQWHQKIVETHGLRGWVVRWAQNSCAWAIREAESVSQQFQLFHTIQKRSDFRVDWTLALAVVQQVRIFIDFNMLQGKEDSRLPTNHNLAISNPPPHLTADQTRDVLRGIGLVQTSSASPRQRQRLIC